MRSRPKVVWLVLLGAILAWALRARGALRPQSPAATAGPQASEAKLPINRPDAARGSGTVLTVGALCAALIALGLAWYAVNQETGKTTTALALTHGNIGHAPALITRYGCGGCHTIPGAP